MILTRVHPAPAESWELDSEGSRERLLELYQTGHQRWLRLNLVTNVSGSAAGPDGTSETLTGASDRRILGVIRQLSDVVLIGAASVRAEGYQLPRRSRLAIVTSSGDLSGHRIEQGAASDILVICPAPAGERVEQSLPGAQILVIPSRDGRVPVDAAIAALRELGLPGIVCEGGPALASQLLSAGLVDELCLTTSPQLGGRALPLLTEGVPQLHLTFRQAIIDDAGYQFSRWAIQSS